MAKDKEATLTLKIKALGQDALDRVVITFGDLVNITKTLASAMQAPIKAWEEQETATTKLNQVLVNNGIYTAKLAQEYQDMAGQLQSVTKFGDDATLGAQATLQAFLGETKITKELTMAVMDLASAKGMDLASAAEMVGKSIGTSTNALARQGIQIDENASKSEKLTEVVSKLNSLYGGQAVVAGNTVSGALAIMNNAIGEVYESIGKQLAPIITTMAKGIASFAMELSTNTQAIDAFAFALDGVLKAGSFIKMVFTDLGGVIGQTLGAAVGGISQMIEGQWSAAWETFKSIPSQGMDVIKQNYQQMNAEFAAIDAAEAERRAAQNEQDVLMAQNAALRRVAINKEEHALKSADFDAAKIQEQIKEQEHQIVMKDTVLREQIDLLNQKIAAETGAVEKLALLREKERLVDAATNKAKAEGADANTKFKLWLQQSEVQGAVQSANFIATMQNAKTKELAAIGKAAAISTAIINTAQAITLAMATIPFPASVAVAAAVGAAGAVQVAKIAGVPLAEGGIVRASQGGTPAIIGEGGVDEAVIPLDSGEARSRLGGGQSVTINFNGPVMGDQAQARDFAIALDRELLKLRRDGESLSFDTRLS